MQRLTSRTLARLVAGWFAAFVLVAALAPAMAHGPGGRYGLPASQQPAQPPYGPHHLPDDHCTTPADAAAASITTPAHDHAAEHEHVLECSLCAGILAPPPLPWIAPAADPLAEAPALVAFRSYAGAFRAEPPPTRAPPA